MRWTQHLFFSAALHLGARFYKTAFGTHGLVLSCIFLVFENINQQVLSQVRKVCVKIENLIHFCTWVNRLHTSSIEEMAVEGLFLFCCLFALWLKSALELDPPYDYFTLEFLFHYPYLNKAPFQHQHMIIVPFITAKYKQLKDPCQPQDVTVQLRKRLELM